MVFVHRLNIAVASRATAGGSPSGIGCNPAPVFDLSEDRLKPALVRVEVGLSCCGLSTLHTGLHAEALDPSNFLQGWAFAESHAARTRYAPDLVWRGRPRCLFLMAGHRLGTACGTCRATGQSLHRCCGLAVFATAHQGAVGPLSSIANKRLPGSGPGP